VQALGLFGMEQLLRIPVIKKPTTLRHNGTAGSHGVRFTVAQISQLTCAAAMAEVKLNQFGLGSTAGPRGRAFYLAFAIPEQTILKSGKIILIFVQ